MPWKQVWVPNDKNLSLPVLKELPAGVHGTDFDRTIWLRWAHGVVDGKFVTYHYCHRCGGWIPGDYVETEEHTLGPLCGREGQVYSCRRCGEEVDFIGAVS